MDTRSTGGASLNRRPHRDLGPSEAAPPRRSALRPGLLATLPILVLVVSIWAWAFRDGKDRGPIDSVERAGPATASAIDPPSGPAASGRLSAEEARGRRIFETGIGSSGRPILASLGGGAGQVPAAVLRCANCHGEDGRGTSEGGIEPPDITWPALTRAVDRPTRRRAPYTGVLLGRAIGLGIDSSGEPLRPAMPRYQISMQEMGDLLAYMRRLGDSPVAPGVSPDRVRLGVLLPPPGGHRSLNRSARLVLEACVERINRGGVYGRRVELDFLDLAEDPARRAPQVDRFLRDREPFALLWGFFAGAEDELADLLARRGVPAVGPFTDFPRVAMPPNRYLFYLHGGAWSEALASVTHVAEGSPDPPRRLAILLAAGRDIADLAGAVEDRARAAGYEAVERHPLPSADAPGPYRDLAGRLDRLGIDALCPLGEPGRWVPLLEAARSLGWRPLVLVPGSLATPRLFESPEEFDDRLVVAFSTRPGPGSGADDRGFARFAAVHGLPGDHPGAQRLAFASAVLLEEALKRAGPDLTRESLVTTLEQFREVPTGVLPAVSYGPNRRVGAPGAYLARIRRGSRTFVATSRQPEPED